MRRRPFMAGACAVAAALGMSACSDGGVTQPPNGEQPVASVAVLPNTISVAVGRTLQLTAVAKARDGSLLDDRVVQWVSSDTTVAKVSASGVVTGVASGSATITGTSENVSGKATVTVTATPTGGMLRTWVGGGSRASDWSLPGNWNPSAEPGAADTVRIPATPNAAVLSRNVEIARLIVSGGSLRTAGHRLAVRQP